MWSQVSWHPVQSPFQSLPASIRKRFCFLAGPDRDPGGKRWGSHCLLWLWSSAFLKPTQTWRETKSLECFSSPSLLWKGRKAFLWLICKDCMMWQSHMNTGSHQATVRKESWGQGTALLLRRPSQRQLWSEGPQSLVEGKKNPSPCILLQAILWSAYV